MLEELTAQRTSRRTFLKGSVAGVVGAAAGAGLLGPSSLSLAQTQDNYVDALVIGSGFGGAIAALRLAEAGVSTVVLERGRRWPIDPNGNTFATFDHPDGRSSWLSTTANGLIPTPIDRYAGVLELIDPSMDRGPIRTRGVSVRTGAGVGGGSIVYNAIHFQPRRELFNQVFAGQVNYDEMAQTYYPRVRSVLGQSTIPNDILNSGYYESSLANFQQAQRADMFHGTLVEYNVDFGIVRQEIVPYGTKRPSAIDGQSWFGLNSGAKNSTDKNYLRLAEATGKVQVVPLQMVTDISEITGGEGRSNGGGLYRVTADEIDLNGTVLRQRTYTCRYLFMGAGSVGTSALLTKARTKGTLPRLNNLVGTDWGGNGDFIAVRGGLGSFLPARGGPCGHFLFEDMANPSAPTNMVELVVPKDFEQIALGGAPGFSLYVGLSAAAPPLGTFSYNPATNATTLNWPNLDSRLNTFSAGVNAMLNRVNAANPGSFNIFNSEDPTYKAMGGPALTAHPVGGVVMGKACDTYGRVLGYSGLYVVDGALVPGGSVGGVNPAWTIAALSERAMDNIISRDFGNRRTRSSLDRVLTA